MTNTILSAKKKSALANWMMNDKEWGLASHVEPYYVDGVRLIADAAANGNSADIDASLVDAEAEYECCASMKGEDARRDGAVAAAVYIARGDITAALAAHRYAWEGYGVRPEIVKAAQTEAVAG